MLNFVIPIEWIFLAMTAVAVLLPYLLLWGEERVSFEQIKVLRPEVAWVSWVQPLISMALAAVVLLAVLGILPFKFNLDSLEPKTALLWMAVIILAVEMLNGAVAAISGVYTLSRKRRLGGTRYVNSERARMAGLAQVFIDACLVAAIFIFAM